MAILVKDIMKLNSLMEMKLLAGEKGLGKSVGWIYVAECFENPLEGIKWLQGGEIVFITGLGLKKNMNVLKMLIEGIYHNGGVGLIINMGEYIKDIPTEIIEISNTLDFPLFSLPWKVKLIDVSKEISNAIILSRLEDNTLNTCLTNLLFGDGNLDMDIKEKALYFGYDFKDKYYICQIEINKFINHESFIGFDSKPNMRVMIIIRDTLERHGFKLPIIDNNDSIIILASSYDDTIYRMERALQNLVDIVSKELKMVDLNIGIGQPCQYISTIKTSLKEAGQAIISSRYINNKNKITFYKDIGVYELILNIENKTILENYIENVLGTILGNRSYMEILQFYFEDNCNISKTADRLFFHRNTLKYKIDKIEELLNCDFKDFNHCMKIKMALDIYRILK